MKHITYIALMIALFVVSCTMDELVPHVNGQKSDKVQVVTCILPFTEHDVTTRAESESTLDYIIFGTKPDNSKVCVYYNHTSNDIINIDRANDFNNSNIESSWLTACDIYVVTNYPNIYRQILADASVAGFSDVKEYIAERIIGVKGGDYFTSIAMDVEPKVNIPESELPRYGQYASSVNMIAGDIPSGTTYTVDLVSLYAKMVFDINVDPTEEAVAFGGNTFSLEGYTVHNLPTTVDLITAPDKHDNVNVHTAIKGSLSSNGINNQTFTFYVPERYFMPVRSAEEFVYPFGIGANIRPEDRDLRQRYKPLLAKGYTSFSDSYDKENDKKATYVTITGVFTNHQGHSYDVSYDIYLGADHIGNFDVERNKQYNNTITIRGINNSSDQSSNNEAVSIDHRVNISRTLPVIVSLRRETLLDAHFEVRPMRIRKNINHSVGEGQTAPTHVKVEVLYGDEDKPDTDGNGNWIGLERSFGDGVAVSTSDLYCVGEGSSAGKRKYFTYDLVDPALTAVVGNGKDIDPLHNSTTVYVPIPATGNECVWIYVDECIQSSPVKDAMRTATIRVSYGTGDTDESFAPMGQPIDYIINQYKLMQLTNEGRTYLIEHEEEYLHNFDSETAYDEENYKTEFEGMTWGLEDIELSHLNDALFITYTPSSFGSWIIDILLRLFGVGSIEEFCNNAIKEEVDPKYDFYLTRDNVQKITPRDYQGFQFNQEIAAHLNSDQFKNNEKTKIEKIQLDETPQSAFAYCYNRNKRKSDGKVYSLNWYLPAIDQMEDIMKSGHSYFEDFHAKYYWSCQPSYLKNEFNITYDGDVLKGSFFTEEPFRARSTMAELDDDNNFKDAVDSSSDLYQTVNGHITKSWGMPNDYVADGIILNSDFDNKYKNHPGNKLRTEKCRVRAVYVNTSSTAARTDNTTLKASDNENGVIDSDGWVQ